MRIAVSLVIALALIWSAAWFTAARSALRSAETWFAEQGAAGLTAGYALLSVEGFPGRLSLRIDGPFLADPVAGPPGGLGWETDVARVEAALPRPGEVTLRLTEAQRLHVGETPMTLTGETLEAMLRLGGLPVAPRAAEATGRALRLQSPEGEARLARLDASLRPEPAGTPAAEATALRLALELGGLDWTAAAGAAPPGGARLDSARLDAVLGFDRPVLEPLPPPDLPLPPPPRLQSVTLEGLSLALGDARLAAAGRVDVDAEGWPDGRLTLRLERLEALLDEAVALGLMAPELAEGWGQALGRLAPAGAALELPLLFEAGRMRLGPLPLGPAPRLAPPAGP